MDPAAQQRRIQNICLLILSTVAVGFVLFWFRGVLVPFVLAVIVAYGLGPLVQLLHRRMRAPRPLAVLLTLFLALVILGLLGALISTSVRQLAANADGYQRQIEQVIDRVINAPLVVEWVPDDLVQELDIRSIIPTKQLGSLLVGTTNAIVDLLSKGLIVMIFVFFLLVGQSAHPAETGVRADVERKIRRYIVVQATISGATGVLVGGVLGILGVPLAMVFGLMAFLLNFIPSIGSIIATLLPVPVVLVSPDISATVAVLAIGIPAAIQLCIGNVITPKVMGDMLDLDPVTILLALMIWGALWGVVGMLLATPITAVMKMLFERLELTAPLARVLAGDLGASPSGSGR